MTERSLAIVAYYFPPDGGAGAQRPLKFAKYLSKRGMKVTVITHPGEAENSWTRPSDQSLQDELLAGFSSDVIRVPIPATPAPKQAIDGLEPWSRATASAVLDLVDQQRAHAILYTMSPFSLVRSAQAVHEARPNVPIILDFRDPWALDGWQPQRTRWHWQKQFNQMREAVEAADGVIANTPECGRLFRDHFPGLDPARLTVITNGYDAADFEADPGEPTLWDSAEQDVVRLVFSGSLCTRVMQFYEGLKGRLKRAIGYAPERLDFSGRTLIPIMQAINQLKAEGDPLANRIRIEVLGVEDESDRRSVEAAGMVDQVRFHGYVPHREAVRHIRLADALLLPLHGLPAGERSRIVPGKTYEYLATGRPILGLLPEGDAREFAESSGRAAIADPCDPAKITDALRRLPGLIERHPIGTAPDPSVLRFERERLSEQLDAFVGSVCNMASNGSGSGAN